jgi:hypothetical protein
MRLVTSLSACPCKFGAIMVQGISENNSHLLAQTNVHIWVICRVCLHREQ